jgi:hemerythrin-like domain-containing protein
MQLIQDLQGEHLLIERVVGSLRTWADAFGEGRAPVEDGRAFLRFFRLWAGAFHHAREEDCLFPALQKVLGLPADRGPVAVILRDHHEMAGLLDELEVLVGPDAPAEAPTRVPAVAKAYSHHLWHHIDAENTVLFPESEHRLVRHGARELAGRAPTEAELAAKREGEVLLERYPPIEDLEVFRGEGCIMCPAYGVSCNGLEREWWNESEWEEIHERLTGM